MNHERKAWEVLVGRHLSLDQLSPASDEELTMYYDAGKTPLQAAYFILGDRLQAEYEEARNE